MAQFYANIKGNRGEATRMGTKNSGMRGHIRGWNIGGRVEMHHNTETNTDQVSIYLTTGSIGSGSDQLLGVWTLDELGNVVERN